MSYNAATFDEIFAMLAQVSVGPDDYALSPEDKIMLERFSSFLGELDHFPRTTDLERFAQELR